ncbi:MAG: VOC family protein, partial [Trebonia sp.]
MALKWYTAVIDCQDLHAQARWWAGVLDWQLVYEAD